MTREEAIKIIRDTYHTDTELEALKVLIPELAESEDERMLREIKRYIKEQGDKPTGLPNGTVPVSDMIAWLEKQSEKKPEVKHIGWVARDSEHNPYLGLGLVLFKEKPIRSGDCWTGVIDSQLPWESFPDLKWEDEPVEVEITIRKK